VILKSQAQLAASLKAAWSAEALETLRDFLRVVEARARAQSLATLVWPAEQNASAEAATESMVSAGASRRANGLLIDARDLFDTAAALAHAGVGPVTAARPDYVFEPACPAVDALVRALTS
jgi:ATP phosphoribosyltransferase